MDLNEYLNHTNTTQEALAEQIGVSQGMVGHWIQGRKRITAERAVDIERATAGMVKKEDLRPDIFGGSSAA